MSSGALRLLPVPGLLGRSLIGGGGRGAGGRGGLPLVERNARAYRHLWVLLISGLLEPLFYLLSIRVGLGALVGQVTGPGGRPVGYTEFVAPALLATSSMNGAVYDSTFNVFHKLKYAKVYDAALATPLRPGDVALGEITWALSRGLLYAIAFLVVLAAMGLVHSAWLLLAIPAAVLIGFAFAGIGMAATTYMRSWKDFDFVILATLPMFLFSTTFYPLSVYPRALQIVVECTPLYQAVTLLRGFALGTVGPAMLVSVAYLAAMGLAGLYVAGRRIRRLLLT
ncbi:MAG TPA: ABC transporter permease [Streptosporangiaceae bacterium]|jgi:lipooligosaccharide transport system permease protein|nr:ABC transporter permease [Streptosporangiaceae bacterium]